MIDPDEISTARVDQLPEQPWAMSDRLPKATGTELKQNTVQTLADFISAYIGTVSSLAFNPTPVPDGGTLPVTSSPEFILLGKGTFHNVGGGADIVTTEELNVATSNGLVWTLAVQIPIDVELAGIVQTIRQGYTSTAPSENAVFDALASKIGIDYLVWGNIQGTLSDQTDLHNALNTKANDANVIHTTGNESKSGILNMTDKIQFGTAKTTYGQAIAVSKTLNSMNAHIFDDYSILNSSISPAQGFGIFDASTEMTGTANYDHFQAYQSRLKFSGSGNIIGDYGLNGFLSLNSNTGTGVVAKNHGVYILDIEGTGPVTYNAGVRIAPILRGDTNWAIDSEGGDSRFNGNIFSFGGKGYYSFSEGNPSATNQKGASFTNDSNGVSFYSIGTGTQTPPDWIFFSYDGGGVVERVRIGATTGRIKASAATSFDEVVIKYQLDAAIAAIRPYKVYTGSISCLSSTITMDVINENTLGGSITWAKTGTGTYTGTGTGLFSTAGKVRFFFSNNQVNGAIEVKAVRTDANTVTITTIVAGSLTDNVVSGMSIEIRVYN